MSSWLERISSSYRFYQWLTDNHLWQAGVREMARHLPPAGATLRLIAIGCGQPNSIRSLSELRPDVQLIAIDRSLGSLQRARHKDLSDKGIQLLGSDAIHLPFPADFADAITVHNGFYLLADQSAFLREAIRVLRPGGRLILLDLSLDRNPISVLRYIPRSPRGALNILLWQKASQSRGVTSLEKKAHILETSGFARVLAERAVEGYAILNRGEKPYPVAASMERATQTANRDVSLSSTEPTTAAALAGLKHLFVFLLIHQIPNRPAWEITPGTPVSWEAATVAVPSVGSAALVFSSLPKAVAFMQPAVKSGALVGVTRIAKIPCAVAKDWSFSILLNPTFESLSGEYQLPGPWLSIDPQSAVTGEE